MPRPRSEKPVADRFDQKRDYDATRQRDISVSGREIGPLPDVKDPARREACRLDPELFATTYFPARYYLPSSPAQKSDRATMFRSVKNGGRFAIARPRGGGKTTDGEVLAMMAIVYGFRKFLVVIGATETHAVQILQGIQAEFETNDRLAEDFPEICYPIRCLERIHNRARGQTLGGKSTRIEWTAGGVTLPTVEGSPSSGAVIRVFGITSAIRGLKVLGPDGEPMRPDFVILDDPQTRDSAESPTQTAKRDARIASDIMGLAGPTTEIAAVMLCTVIYRNDLSDRYLDPEKHPEWQGSRSKLVESWPTNMAKWDEYAEIRRESFRSGDEGRSAADFYIDHQAELDAGAVVPWPGRMKEGEASEIQSAMNLYYDDPRGFHSEYQNDPQKAELSSGAKELTAEGIMSRLSGCERYTVPAECSRVTVGIDCGLFLHWYCVVAWNESFGGSIVDYGCFPRQQRAMFEASDARPSLATEFAGMTEPQLVFAGLNGMQADVLGRTYFRQGGGEVRVERALVDSGFSTKSVYQWVRQSPYAGVVHPSKGIGRTTTSVGVARWKSRPGERTGFHWRLTAGEEGRTRAVQFDPDAWKTFLHAALTTPLGGQTGINLWGKLPSTHEQISNHLSAEYSEPVTLRGDTFDKWAVRPDRPDNHLLDTLVLAAVAASVAGLTWSATGQPIAPAPPKPLKKWSEMQAEKQRAH